MPTIVKMPKWGLTMTTGTVVAWMSELGTEISEGDPLLTVETEKAVDDVPAPADGVLYRIVAASGTEVAVSAPVAIILSHGESASDEEIDALIAAASPAAQETDQPADSTHSIRERRAASRDRGGRINASPAARKLAAELGVDLATVDATGPGGRITSDDVQIAADSAHDPSPVESDVLLDDGRALRVLTAGPKSDLPFVFLHGLGGSLSTWQIVLGGLAESHYVVAIDLPGHGKSSKADPEGTAFSIAGLAEAIGQVLTRLRVSRAVVAGHSLGGAVALELARLHPDQVAALCLINSAGMGASISAELSEIMLGEPGEDTATALLNLFMEDKKYVAKRAIEDMSANQLGAGSWTAQQAIAAQAFAGGSQITFVAEHLPEVSQPALIIWGDLDRVIPLVHAIDGARAIPNSWLALLPGVGHVPQVEQPDAVTRHLDRFVRSLA